MGDTAGNDCGGHQCFSGTIRYAACLSRRSERKRGRDGNISLRREHLGLLLITNYLCEKENKKI